MHAVPCNLINPARADCVGSPVIDSCLQELSSMRCDLLQPEGKSLWSSLQLFDCIAAQYEATQSASHLLHACPHILL